MISLHSKLWFRYRFVVLCSILLIASIFCQFEIRKVKHNVTAVDQLKYLPSGTFLKGAALSFDSVLADLLWIKAIAYFSDKYVSDRDYSWLFHHLDISTTLDPYFEDPYEFGGIVLANVAGDIEKSSILLKKGMKNVSKDHPRYWYLPFFLGFNYWYYKKDFKAGSVYLEIASRFPQAPAYLPMLTARMYADTSQVSLALPFLDEMISSARTSEQRAELQQRKKEVLVNRDLDFLDRAIKNYHKRFAKYPNSLEELRQKNIIRVIPVEPFGGLYYYDPILHTAHSNLKVRIKIYKPKILN